MDFFYESGVIFIYQHLDSSIMRKVTSMLTGICDVIPTIADGFIA